MNTRLAWFALCGTALAVHFALSAASAQDKASTTVKAPPAKSTVNSSTVTANPYQTSAVSAKAPQVPAAAAKAAFTQAELDQMLAPVALYPDTVLSHVLIAATYPLEIVKATRWLSGKPGMTSEQALKAAENESWDPSVRALVAFPPLLTKMNNELEWTQRLGDAFLVQEKQVMDTVQSLRQKAYAAGNLQNQQHITVERKEKVIVIEPRQREVVYVPVYDTRRVYGDWWWQDYPPVHWPYPTGYQTSSSIYWGVGSRVSAGFYFSTFYWPQRQIVVIHHNRPNYYYQPAEIIVHEDRRHWRHNPAHRHGVVYNSHYQPTRESYGPAIGGSQVVESHGNARRQGDTWRYEDENERRRWAAERRQQNNVSLPGDQQIIEHADAAAAADPDRERLQRISGTGFDRNSPLPKAEPIFNDPVISPDQVSKTEQPISDLPVYQTPESDRPSTEPVFERPERQIEQPEPVYQQPEPVYQQPEPVYQQPEPVYQQPEPVYQQPEPVYQRPEPVQQQPEPVYQRQEPVYQRPEPVYQRQEQVYQQPEPVYQRAEPIYQQPQPAPQRQEPVYQRPEPATQSVIESPQQIE